MLALAAVFSLAIAGSPTVAHRQRFGSVQSARRASHRRVLPNVRMSGKLPETVGSFEDIRDTAQQLGHIVIPDENAAGAHEVAANSYACPYPDAAMCAAKATIDAALIQAESARETAVIAAAAARETAVIAAAAAHEMADATLAAAEIGGCAVVFAAVTGAVVMVTDRNKDGIGDAVKVLTPPPWALSPLSPKPRPSTISTYQQYGTPLGEGVGVARASWVDQDNLHDRTSTDQRYFDPKHKAMGKNDKTKEEGVGSG